MNEDKEAEQFDDDDGGECGCCWRGSDYFLAWVGFGVCVLLILVGFALGMR